MVKYRIHFELRDGSSDSVVLEAENIENLRELAQVEANRRHARDAWSEELPVPGR